MKGDENMNTSKLYTIHPLIMSDSIPSIDTKEYLVSKYFYLFNAYSTNFFKLKNYMDFINNNFDNVFENLGYRIMNYEYPSDLEDDLDIINWINKHYKLTGSVELDYYYSIDKNVAYDYVSKQKMYVYMNKYLKTEPYTLHWDLFEHISNILDDLRCIIEYLNNKDMRNIIKLCINFYSEYMTNMEYYVCPDDSLFNTSMVSESLLSLTYLKLFLKYTKGE